MKIKTEQDLIKHKLNDLLSAENQLVEKLPQIAKNVNDKDLKMALNEHLKQTKEHVKRLKQIAKELDIDTKDEKCKGMEGILKEGEKAMDSTDNDVLLDIVTIAGCRSVEHYEMAGYMAFISLLDKPEYKSSIDLLNETLVEEQEADKKLASIVNKI